MNNLNNVVDILRFTSRSLACISFHLQIEEKKTKIITRLTCIPIKLNRRRAKK